MHPLCYAVRRRAPVVLWGTLALFVFLVTVPNSSNPSRNAQHHLDKDGRPTTHQSLEQYFGSVPDCDFDVLRESFSSAGAKKGEADGDDTCWNLADEILQVPVSAILNRHDLPVLGQGRAGGAYKAMIQLKSKSGSNNNNNNNNNSSDQACFAALKTDLCQFGRFHPITFINNFMSKKNYGTFVSCVVPGTHHTWFSFVKGEITGMLVHYSLFRRNLPIPEGVIPTYAVVTKRDGPPVTQRRKWWQPDLSWSSYSPDNPTHVGVLLPLRKFAGMRRAKNLPSEPVAVAEIMLPAVEALQVYHRLGLVHQDVHASNVALDAATGRSLLYDNGLLAQLGECDAGDDESWCDYCTDDPTIGRWRFAHKAVDGLNPRESDVYRMAELIVNYFLMKYGENEETNGKYRDQVLACTTATQLRKVLESWKQQ